MAPDGELITDQLSGVEQAAPGEVRVRRALLSVSDKQGLVEFARGLQELGVELVSTGGTARELESAGIAVRAIEDFTGFPEIMDGRVKTLHPRLYAGLLARRDEPAHLRAAQRAADRAGRPRVREPLPLRADRRARRREREEIVENIDIGGPTMIRAAAKNAAFAAVVVDPADYETAARRAARERRQALAANGAKSSRPRPSRAPRATTPRSRPGLRARPTRASRLPRARPTRRSAICATARTRTRALPSMRVSARRRTCSRASSSCTARSCPSTTCSISAPHASLSRTSRSRLARSSSTTTPAAARSARADRRPTSALSPAIRRAPTAA